jgi:chromosome segregation ATPase
MEQQIKDMTGHIHDYEDKKQKMELDLKAAVDKIVDLREIIFELETQIEGKSVAEHIFNEKIQELQNYVDMQDRTNETLNQEVESLKYEVDGRAYNEHIANLEAELQKTRPGDEQSLQLEQISDQLKTIESELDRKTKTLELLHTNLCSLSCSSPSEDVSVKHDTPEKKKKKNKADADQDQLQSLPVDEVQRILVKLEKHNRVEEAAIKRIQDLEMQISGVRNSAAVSEYFFFWIYKIYEFC